MDSGTEKLFPRDRLGRVALALVSVVLGPVCGAMAIALVFGERPIPSALGWLLWAILEEIALALALYFACALIWAIATPRWLERRLPGVARTVAIVMALAAAALLSLMIWAFFVLKA